MLPALSVSEPDQNPTNDMLSLPRYGPPPLLCRLLFMQRICLHMLSPSRLKIRKGNCVKEQNSGKRAIATQMQHTYKDKTNCYTDVALPWYQLATYTSFHSYPPQCQAFSTAHLLRFLIAITNLIIFIIGISDPPERQHQ